MNLRKQKRNSCIYKNIKLNAANYKKYVIQRSKKKIINTLC